MKNVYLQIDLQLNMTEKHTYNIHFVKGGRGVNLDFSYDFLHYKKKYVQIHFVKGETGVNSDFSNYCIHYKKKYVQNVM